MGTNTTIAIPQVGDDGSIGHPGAKTISPVPISCLGEVAGGTVIVVGGAVRPATVFAIPRVVGIGADIHEAAVYRIISHALAGTVVRVHAVLARAELSDRDIAHLARGHRRDRIV